MEKCDYVWIFAPITWVVGDQTAQDLLWHTFKSQWNGGLKREGMITFVVTKCDDISCLEVIHSLHLEDEPALKEIEALLGRIKGEAKEWRRKQRIAEKASEENGGDASQLQREAADALLILGDRETLAQREKNTFCSIKRSERSRGILKADFCAGLKDLDDMMAESVDPSNFDPATNIREYTGIDLPMFMVSSRDYVRLTEQVEGDGGPTCFSRVEDTGIPLLREWCLTLGTRRHNELAQ